MDRIPGRWLWWRRRHHQGLMHAYDDKATAPAYRALCGAQFVAVVNVRLIGSYLVTCPRCAELASELRA